MGIKGTMSGTVLLLALAATGYANVAINTALGATVGKTDQHATHKPTPKPVINAAQWMTVDMKHKTITLKLVAGYQGKNGGLNFNGFSNGDMGIEVPLNWRVNINFTNEDTRPHSVTIVPYAQRKSKSLRPAFTGAWTPGASHGIGNGQSQSFSFKPTKQGQYAIVSAVPGNGAAGLWDTIVVYPNAAPGIGAK